MDVDPRREYRKQLFTRCNSLPPKSRTPGGGIVSNFSWNSSFDSILDFDQITYICLPLKRYFPPFSSTSSSSTASCSKLSSPSCSSTYRSPKGGMLSKSDMCTKMIAAQTGGGASLQVLRYSWTHFPCFPSSNGGPASCLGPAVELRSTLPGTCPSVQFQSANRSARRG